MGPDQDQTRDLWICSQTRICSQTYYQLRYVTWYHNDWHSRTYKGLNSPTLKTNSGRGGAAPIIDGGCAPSPTVIIQQPEHQALVLHHQHHQVNQKCATVLFKQSIMVW